MLVLYDFHCGISNKEKYFMFAIEPILFSMGTIAVNLITLACLNLVEYVYVLVELVYVLHFPSYILVESIYVLHVHIIISLNIFKKKLSKFFFQLEMGELEIDETLARIRVQILCIVGWIVTKE